MTQRWSTMLSNRSIAAFAWLCVGLLRHLL